MKVLTDRMPALSESFCTLQARPLREGPQGLREAAETLLADTCEPRRRRLWRCLAGEAGFSYPPAAKPTTVPASVATTIRPALATTCRSTGFPLTVA